MSRNVGRMDQYVRIVAGLALVAFAFQNGLSIQGWHWLGLAGFVMLLTAFLSLPCLQCTGNYDLRPSGRGYVIATCARMG